MKTSKLLWIPRVLAMVFIVFLSLFGLGVFSGEAPLIQKLGGFLIHSIPSLTLLIALIISWKKPLIGGVLFILFSLAFTIFLLIRGGHSIKIITFLGYCLVFLFPSLLFGALFIVLGKRKV